MIELGGRWEAARRRGRVAQGRRARQLRVRRGVLRATSDRCGTGGSSPIPRVDAPEGNPQRARLCFAAVDYFADVWLNDELLGHHEGYFAPFGFDVTERLRKNNEVLVRVQDPLEPLDPDQFFFEHKKRIIKGTLKYHDSRPGGLPGPHGAPARPATTPPRSGHPEWGQSMTTAGIVGPVTLTRTGDVAISALFVTPLDHETGTVQIAVVLTNHDDAPTARPRSTSRSKASAPRSTSRRRRARARVDVLTDLPDLDRWEPVHSPHGAPSSHELVAVAVVATGSPTAATSRSGCAPPGS